MYKMLKRTGQVISSIRLYIKKIIVDSHPIIPCAIIQMLVKVSRLGEHKMSIRHNASIKWI